MTVRVLLVNPWACDFAAANHWSRPLGLYRVGGILGELGAEVALVDLMDACAKAGPFGTGKYPRTVMEKPAPLAGIPRRFARYGAPEGALAEALGAGKRPDLVLVTSLLSYWYPGVQLAIAIVRERLPGVPVVLGGVYATLWPEHARNVSGADVVFEGPAEEGLPETLERETGVRFPSGREAAGRRGFPPGEPAPYYRMPFAAASGYRFAAIQTGAGCPFRCPYCASDRLSARPFRRSPASVVEEVAFLHAKGTRDFAFYDDALLHRAQEHLVPVLEETIRRRLDVRFHAPNGLHARYLDADLARLMRRAGFVTVRLSLETVGAERQLRSGKVTCGELARAVEALKGAGYGKREVGVYLMYGLPGQPFGEVEEGVEFLASLGVRVHLAEYSPIPGTAHWDELVRAGTLPPDPDPLLTNNTVFAALFGGLDAGRVERLRLRVKEHNRA